MAAGKPSWKAGQPQPELNPSSGINHHLRFRKFSEFVWYKSLDGNPEIQGYVQISVKGTVPEVQDTVVATLFIEPFRLGIHGFGSGP
ncbi:hypothetical protein NC653_024434 [Populus alba x Populus x berolinensis]|uniref:Uncharacterized protein n=1 Tax=Populus alba x Populus x berolinensis TaxID=444605 RepID=A0AAD6M9D5_9ROSI|nr:hypothetical protein NC653_024434 [Populus alba x Populus x berolinensis]